MRVLKHGDIDMFIKKCNHCGAELEIVPHDIKSKVVGDNLWTYIICLDCGKAIVLTKKLGGD